MEKHSYVYILASAPYGTLYIGVTADLIRRIHQHRDDLVEGFTKHHKVHHLVWYEQHADITTAIQREKQLKQWNRGWKTSLISKSNPAWHDLYDEIATSY